MDHLYPSVVKAQIMKLTMIDGTAAMNWVDETHPKLRKIKCRLDLIFLRPGKDQPTAPEAGVAPDRIGVMFCDSDVPLRAGHRVVAIPNKKRKIVVPGTFDLRISPDMAQDYDSAHHQEIQVVEATQDVKNTYTPGIV